MHKRRDFLKLSASVTAGAAFLASNGAAEAHSIPDPIQNLKPMMDGIVPITDDERRSRIEQAQRLMVENKIGAIFLEPGTSVYYYTGLRTWISERMIGLVIPARGELSWICPKFEEDRMREVIRFGTDFRTWEEDESPYKVVAGIFRDRGIRTGTIGIEEQVRFFLCDGIRKATTGLEYVSADPITIGCRVIKSPAEIALMQKASDITIAAYKAAVATLKEGMTPDEFSANCRAAFRALGTSGEAGANFGVASALPHGSTWPQKLKEGDVVLMDGGCSIEGYKSDISRTVVLGQPSQRARDIWNLARRAQGAAFAAAKVGVSCEAVDAAARKVITDAGFGPGYKVPGLPHRTGHGIGLDGHEWTNLVRGNKTLLKSRMCFSNEPMVSIPGEFGVRLEDCMYITEEGARFFSQPSAAIDQP